MDKVTWQSPAATATAGDGSTIRGTVIRWGDKGNGFVFRKGAVTWQAGRPILNLNHARGRLLGRHGVNLELHQTEEALTLAATLPATDTGKETYQLLQAGILSWLSCEVFVTRYGKPEGNIRVIEAAELVGVAFCDVPGLPDSRLQFDDQTRPRRRRFFL